MAKPGLSTCWLAAVVLSACFRVDLVFGAQPSFDCSKASSQDQIAICSNDTLAIVDNVANNGFEYLRSKLGRLAANKINLPLIKKRQACGGNYQCILNTQIEAINTFIRYGAPIAIPSLSGDYHQQNNVAREELGANSEASPHADQEEERRRQAEVEAARQSALEAENKRQEEVEGGRHSAQQAESQRRAEADSVEYAFKEVSDFVKERLRQIDVQIALMIVSGLLLLGGAFFFAKTMVKRKQAALGPSLVENPVDHKIHYESSMSIQSTLPSAEPAQSSIDGRSEALQYAQAEPFSECQTAIATWYYEKEGKSFGPVTADIIKTLLKNNEINKDTFVWNESLGTQWVPIQKTELI